MTIFNIILSTLARLTLWRHKPQIVGITGSVGKTSAKTAIATVLRQKLRLWESPENYNNEIGLPLSILGEHSAGKNVIGWIWVIIKSFFKLFAGDYPKILVLEMGTDRPGDLARLGLITGKLNVAVITDIGISHLEFFSSPQALAREKLSIIKGLAKNGVAMLNLDSAKIVEALPHIKASFLGYGFNPKSQILASDYQITTRNGDTGITFKVHYKGTVVPFFIPGALGKPAAYAALASAGVGLHFGMNLVEISQGVKELKLPAGRLRLITGVKRTSIIDDTYNAAPASVIAALDVLKTIGLGRKVAALGKMTELGSAMEQGHREVAAKIMEAGVKLVFLVGTETKHIEDELKKRQFDGAVYWFENSDQACMPVQNKLLEGDTVLVKGSQSARMEKIVKEIMASPMQAEELLVRQSKKWLNKP